MVTPATASLLVPRIAAKPRSWAADHLFPRVAMAAVVFIVGGAPLARIDVGSTLDTFVGNKLGTVEIATVATGEQARHFAPQRRAESESPSRAHHRAEVAVQVATAAQAEIARWATGRFTEAGLELPALSLTFHEGREKCGGNHGSFRREDGVAQVEICNAVPHVVLHELAHAWEAAAVDDRTRRGFIDALGLAAWNSPEVAWSDRGIERAANTIALVLNWEANPMSDAAAFSRLCAYELLTGKRLPDDIPAGCDGASPQSRPPGSPLPRR